MNRYMRAARLISGMTIVLMFVMPSPAKAEGSDRIWIYGEGTYGFYAGWLKWEGNHRASIDIIVQDSRYDGWCSFGYAMTEQGNSPSIMACGVNTSTQGVLEIPTSDADDLEFIAIQLCGYYPPTGWNDCPAGPTIYVNPLSGV